MWDRVEGVAPLRPHFIIMERIKEIENKAKLKGWGDIRTSMGSSTTPISKHLSKKDFNEWKRLIGAHIL